MNVDAILATFNGHGADYILIGGMMILCQLALPEPLRKLDRIRSLGYDPRQAR